MIKTSILISIILIICSSFNFSQNDELLTINDNRGRIKTEQVIYNLNNDTLNNKDEIMEKNFSIGLQIGMHSKNLGLNSIGFSKGLYVDLFSKFDLSKEVFLIIKFNYWQAKIEKNEFINGDLIIGKLAGLGVDFTLFNIDDASFLIGPSILIGSNSEAANAIFSLGVGLKLNIPLYNEKFNFSTSVEYEKASEILNFGGGISYSFFCILIGIELKI